MDQSTDEDGIFVGEEAASAQINDIALIGNANPDDAYMMEVFCAGINVDDTSLFRPVPGSIVDDHGLWYASPCGSVSEHDSGSPSAGEKI